MIGRHRRVRPAVAAVFPGTNVSVGQLPTGVAVAATRAYVANELSNSVSVIDLTQNPPTVMATIAVGTYPDAAALSADGSRLYVPNYTAGTLSIISTSTNTVSHTVTVGSRPDGTVEIGGSVYVANLTSGTISVIDPSAGTVTRTIALPAGTTGAAAPSGLAASGDGKTLYANDARNGQTDVIDLTQTPPAVTGHVAVGSFPAYLSVGGSTGYVANPGSNSVSVLDLTQSPPAQTSTVTVGSHPYGVIALPSLGEAFATNSGSGNMSVIDTTAGPPAVLSTVPTGTTPDAVAVSPDNSTAVVSNEGSNTVSIYHVNDAPQNTVPGSQNVNANGSASTHNKLTFSSGNSNQISTSDGDAGTSPVKITLSVSHGTLTLSGTSGLSFSSGSNGSGSMTFTGTLSDVNTALAGMTYEPATSYQGSDTLSLTDDDQGHTGIGKAEATTSTVSISVNNVAPTAGDVSYSGAIGNTTFGVGTSPSAPSTTTTGTVLSNSSDANGDTLSAVAGTITTANSGSVQMNSDGTFTYSPPPGFTGNDTFTFQVSDGTTTSSGTATVTVANMVWYVNRNNSTNGNGTSSSPYNTLSPFATTGVGNPSGNGNDIFLYGSSTAYGGGVALKSSQTLLSQSVGLTVAGHTLVGASGSNATVTNSGGAGVTLGEGTTVSGITVDSTSGAGVTASGVNSFTLDSSDTISNTTGDAVHVSGGNGTINDGATISTSGGHSVLVSGRTGGTMTNSGAITDDGAGISLSSNTGATVGFSGKITASTGSNQAFTATGGGTVAATGTGSTLTSTTGTALDVASTTIGTGGLNFQAISANGAANGIVLSSTGTTAGLTVSGTGSAGSGGTIQNATGDAISLASTSSPSFNWMNISSPQHKGVNGTGVHGFSYTNGTISGAGAAHSQQTDAAFAFNNNSPAATNDNLDGAVTITGNTISSPYGSGVDILNFNGTISDANISSNTLTSTTSTTTSKGSAIALNLFGNATTVPNLTQAEIQNNVITNFPSGYGINVQGGNNTTGTAPAGVYGTPGTTNAVQITGNQANGSYTGGKCLPGNGACMGLAAINANVTGRGQGNFNISTNGTTAHPLGRSVGSPFQTGAAGNVTANFAIENNVVSAFNAGGGDGIGLGVDKNQQADSTILASPAVKATITGNNVSNYDGGGVHFIQLDSNGSSNLKMDSNTTSSPESDNQSGAGIEVDEGSSGSASYNPSLCSEIKSNTAAAGNANGFGDAVPGIVITKESTSSSTYSFGIVGLSPSPANESQTESYLAAQNPSSAFGAGFYSGARAFANPGDQWTSCTLPTMP